MIKLSSIATITSFNPEKNEDNVDAFWITSAGEFKLLKKLGKRNPQYVFRIIPKKGVNKDFLFLLLQRPIDNLNKEYNASIGVKRLTISKLKEVLVPKVSEEVQLKFLNSKNVKKRIQDLWLENGVRTYEEPLKVDMSFDELLKVLSQPKG